MVSINSNIISLKISRQLGKVAAASSTSFQRLSSGSRLNKASDDPGGLSVAVNLNTSKVIKTRGALNAGDGVSALQIASGALDSANVLLSRMAELAGEGSNGSYSASQRAALDREFSQLGLELQRIAQATTFNGQNLTMGQKSARAAVQIATNAVGAFGATGDGRYITSYNSTNSRLEQLDTTTGVTTTIASLTNASSISTTNNGDVAFVSSSNVSGLNSSGYSQLFYYNRDTGGITRITSSGVGEGIIATISPDGSKMAFSSRKLYSATGGDDGSAADYAVHIYDLASGVFSRSADTDYSGGKLVLSSDGAYLGIGAARTHGLALADADYLLVGKTSEIATSSAMRELGSISNSNGTITDFNVLNDGRLIYFSEVDQGGLSVNSARQVFEYTYGTAAYRKLTNLSAGQDILNLGVKNDGSAFTFTSNSNFLGENSGLRYQAFRINLANGTSAQLTNFSDTTLVQASLVSLSNDGNTLFYRGTANRLTQVDISAAGYDLGIDTGNGATGAILTTLGAIDGALKGLGTHGLTSQRSSRAALDFARLNINRTGSLQGVVGASMSRLESASRLLAVEQSMFAAAYSRIADVDVAEEAAQSVRNQILQSTGSALLAQANLTPKLALSFLTSS